MNASRDVCQDDAMTDFAPPIDPVALTRALVRCPSVTPEEGGALDLLQRVLEPLGFECHRLTFSEAGTPDVENLYARRGEGAPNVCFAGHTDVVPPGDPADWTHGPFAGEIADGELYGRGAVDMKGAIACWIAALSRLSDRAAGEGRGSLSLLITGDEEGPSINGTRKVLDWLRERGERLDYCLVGEPTSRHEICDTVKIGRRGSLNATLTIQGTQGHVAYPHAADNPVHRMAAAISNLLATPLDEGNDHFQPSMLQVTSIDVGNPASNVIPAKATAQLNVRFNDLHTSADVESWLRERIAPAAPRFVLVAESNSAPFLTRPGPLSDTVAKETERLLNRRPALTTDGGTSDARFIKDACPVVELGLRNWAAHQVDERVALEDLTTLTDVYEAILSRLLDAQCSQA